MRLPFPEKVSLIPVCFFAVTLCTLQVYQGTAVLFAFCSFCFIIVAAIAFNVAGGITRPSGAYIFFFSILVVIVGLVWKAVLGEPADSNLLVPMLTIEVYLCTICGMLAAAIISKRITPRRAWLAGFVTDDKMQSATVGCLVTGVILQFMFAFFPSGEGTVLSALGQLNRFPLMAIVLGVIHAIRRSQGKTSVSLPVLLAGGIVFIIGVLGFSKEGMITPFVLWLLAASSQRYKVSVGQIAGGVLVALFIFQYLVPYSQYGRNYHEDTFTGNLDVSIGMLTHLADVRREFKENEIDDASDELAQGYFNSHQGFFDRLQMIGPDDSLNNLTQSGVVAGLTPVFIYFANYVPHFIWKNKPSWGGGNLYAHQMGYLADDDNSTGISFSPAGEAFHLMRWTGVLILAPVLFIMLFTLFDSLCGDVRESPLGLLVVLAFAHIGPEGGVGILIYSLCYMTIGLLFIAFASAYVMPIVGDITIGPPSRMVRFRDPLKVIPKRDKPLDAAGTVSG